MSYFNDPEFQESLLAFIIRDRNFLKKCGDVIDAADFRPRKNRSSIEKWIIADLAISFWNKYRQPVRKMLRSEILAYAKKANLSTAKKEDILYLEDKLRKRKLIAADAIEDRLIEWKKEKLKNDAVQELIELNSSGDLTDEKWLEICSNAVDKFSRKQYTVTDYFDEPTFEDRIVRRERFSRTSFPLLLIDSLDQRIRAISFGHTGILIAPWKRGKSMGLIHITTAYTAQGLNVLYLTLEDPVDDVLDRFDANISALPLQRLNELPNRLRQRFLRQKELMRGRFRVVDGTAGGMTISRIENIYLEQRNKGFNADAMIIDYDAFIEPERRRENRRDDFIDIYGGLQKRLAGKHSKIVWSASQTNADARDKKIIDGSESEEDRGKPKRVALAIGLGKGDWGDDSIFVWIAAHKYDQMKLGWNIMMDKTRMLLYDREKTMRMMIRESEKKKEEGENNESE